MSECKRNLASDLVVCENLIKNPGKYGGVIGADLALAELARFGWPHAIKRAMEAEAKMQSMRHCVNCLFFNHIGNADESECSCELERAGKECINFSLWEWDGGNYMAKNEIGK